MNVYLNKITGIDDAIVSMYMSKRTWTRELEVKIRNVCNRMLDAKGSIIPDEYIVHPEDQAFFMSNLNKIVKWGARHMTMLRFIDISVTVEGMHRAGQDDVDSHAKRFDNRIIRSSTRLAKFATDEMSDYYRGKIIPTDVALAALGIVTPEEIEYDGVTYVKTVNGYVQKGMEENKDVLRGLYMLSIPSNFIFKCQLTEWAHVYKERNNNGTANPEVKEFCESVCDQIEQFVPLFNRELYDRIPN